MKKKIGLYFGSFNPPHVGHMIIANYLLEFSELDELHFIVSPQNPLKNKKTLLDARNRLELVRASIDDYPNMKANDIEFSLPQPNYTIHTLIHLEEKLKDHSFYLIMGMDNLQKLHKWKAYQSILKHYNILVYPRPGFDGKPHIDHPSVQIIDAPLMEISSSFIRKSIKKGQNIKFFLRNSVYNIIDKEGLYQ